MPTPRLDTGQFVHAPEPEPGRVVRAWRFVSVAWVAANIYAGYKSIQLWSRIVGDARKEERYRRQDGRAARALYRSAVRLQGMLIKACQFIATPGSTRSPAFTIMYRRARSRRSASASSANLAARSTRSSWSSIRSRSPQPRSLRFTPRACTTAADAP
jgi:hypothetical protein